MRLAVLGAALSLCCVTGCEGKRSGRVPEQRPASCPQSRRVEPPLAQVAPEHRTLEYWLTRNETYGALDDALLSVDGVERHNQALQQPVAGEPLGQADLLAPIDVDALQARVEERLEYMKAKLEAGELVDEDGRTIDADEVAMFDHPATLDAHDDWRVVEKRTALRCGPHRTGLYQQPIDVDFDRNRCSTMREGEVVQLLVPWPNGMALARTPYTLGWVRTEGLSTPMSRDEAEARLARVPAQPFTRRAVLTEAFSMLGAPYGWGGKGGGYDCSRFLLEVFARFGIELPRHSARQAIAGTFSVDVSTVEDPNEKRLLLEAAAHRGIVLLHFPGHIMLYLGATEDGTPMAIHAFSEFLTPCEGTELETINRVDRVAVSDLTLGAGSTRRDFLSRVARITVFGRPPGPALVANAELRASAPVSLPEGRCGDSKRIAIHRSPLRPDASRPLRVIVTSERDPGPASLVLFAPDGTRVGLEPQALDGPPHGRWVEVTEPAAGPWTAVLADGELVLACERIQVAKRPALAERREAPGPAWAVLRRWDRDSENLYSAFVEQLFRDPVGEDVTWTQLQEVIGDPARNLLYDYRAPGEDDDLDLEPDCADLPYFLRAYFAWKLRLPFVYRQCTRGLRDQPPRCEPSVLSNLDAVPDSGDTAAFRRFIRRLAGTVHSSSPRTLPEDDETDFYPLRLGRQALRPGTIFADPYGHVLVVARWQPQSLTDYGVLIGADAQPDGTVGRRRFWRGSFLFTPKSDLVGSGFKGWRPVEYDPSRVEDTDTEAEDLPQPWRIATNQELRDAKGIHAWSDMQYSGTADDFYSIMEGFINPRALDPVRMQISLVDALEESVQRRLSSVQNGEDFMKAEGYAMVDMPHGAALFLTVGPWEDYSTPSRDMRLLISIDAVVSFPAGVAAHPERFGILEANREEAVKRVRDTLDAELERRSFQYTRSDGSPWTLTLADVVARMQAMEMAYNPNDCVEIRWAAPEGSEERATCKREAPAAQRKRMEKYRNWFAKRERPG